MVRVLFLASGCSTPPHWSPADTGDGSRRQLSQSRCAVPGERATDGPFISWSSPEWATQEIVPESAEHPSNGGWGVVVADLDGDGLPDLYVPQWGTDTLWLSDGSGGWVRGEDPPSSMPDMTNGAAAGDIDGDGDLDLVVVRGGPLKILRNAGDATFTEELVLDIDEPGFSTTLGDIDGDGDLDILQAGFARTDGYGRSEPLPPGHPVRVALNDGTGRFTEGTGILPMEDNDGYPFTIAFVDIDLDADPDIVVANDHGNRATPTRLWRNDGGIFTDISDETGVALSITAMGLGIGDLNGDLVPDLAISGTDEVALLESQPSGIWARTDRARAYRPDRDAGQNVAWAVDMGDVDNDRKIDIFTGYGWWPSEPQHARDQPDGLYIQQPDGSFLDRAPDWGIDDVGWTRGALLVDLNGDGWLDVVRRRLHELPRVDLARCGTASFLVVRPRSDGPNAFGVGARVEVDIDGVTLVRQVLAGGHSLSSGGPPEAHFGLGSASLIDEVRVVWPGGDVTRETDVKANQHIEVWR